MTEPTVTVVVPTLNEEADITAVVTAIVEQTYDDIVEVLVIDGGSTDRTVELATAAGATVLHNPHRIQAAALNIGIEAAVGDVFVRVDGHCVIASDYVERCVAALDTAGAVIVGGAMTAKVASGWQGAVSLALSTPLGAGPARFHVGGEAGWVDTVYLGAYRVDDARAIGGYEEIAVNEDAEFAIRMAARGGIWFDPTIRSSYTPRSTVRDVVRQFSRYGWYRAGTVRRHPSSLAPRQLAAPALVLGLVSPLRRIVGGLYLLMLVLEGVRQARRSGIVGAMTAMVLPAMHLPWGAGFLAGVVTGSYDSSSRSARAATQRAATSPSP